MSLQTAVKGYSCRGQRGIEEHWYHTGKRRQSSIDEKVLLSVDADTLKKVLDGDTGLASKISFVSGRISQNAASNVVSTSSQYTSNGSSLLSALETSKYDFWG